MNDEIFQKIRELQIGSAEQWIEEAIFGFEHVSRYCEGLPARAKVLEIGCGSGILLATLSNSFNKASFQGIEPFGDGFASLLELNQAIQKTGVFITTGGYECFETEERFDLIFCVNVFEHLPDWKLFLSTVPNWLTNTGRLLILCPNYGFPYESHFRLPIIINKTITYRLFRSKIDHFEERECCHGLWKSLNFFTKRAVTNFLESDTNLIIYDDLSIVIDLIERLHSDTEFRKRQRVIGAIGLVLKRAGFLKLMPLFRNFLPYMKIEITRLRSK